MVRRNSQRERQILLEPHRAAAAGMQRIAFRHRIKFGHRRARLQCDAGHPLHPGFQLNHLRRACKCGCGLVLITDIPVQANVRACVVPHARCICTRSRTGRGYRGEDFVFNLHALGAVLGCRQRIRDHHDQRFADVAYCVYRQRMLWR